jgi:putative ABC transport system permease protein
MWPGQDPLGKRIKMGSFDSKDAWRTVVGVATASRYRDIRSPRATLYVPAEQLMVSAQALVVRTTGSITGLTRTIAEQLHVVDPAVGVLRVERFDQLLEGPLARPRFTALLTGVFGAVALFLSAVGLYAVMAAYVTRREHEIGVRFAVGATVGQIRRLVLGEGFALTATGLIIGLVVAVPSTRWLKSLLFAVDPLDPLSSAATALVLVTAALLACYLPARRAARADPLRLMRAH